MNKNWNDRADKDLFFTILNVKNIGVISGSEWTTIGNTMRSMGYGFTNEGCRQHFQGLRRAQAKSESSPSPALPNDGTRKTDPTLNPITRRPGPGRGRPKKAAANANQEGSNSPATGSTGALAPGAPPAAAPQPMQGVSPGQSVPHAPLHSHYPNGSIAPGGPDVSGLQIDQKLSQPMPLPPAVTDRALPPTAEQTPISDELAVDPSLEDSEEPAVKRPRLDDSQTATLQTASLDTDEAMLSALAAHNNRPPSVDNFEAE
ncbi:hypothetical protein V8F20_000277 [Naviculisporaceae sp. PSN 640]